jgi:putative transcriptional regulator
MDKKLFADLYESVKQMDQIRKGRRKPSRVRRVEDGDVRAMREKTGLSQSQFALFIGVSLRTLQNWEQGRRHPVGPARALLKIVRNDPEGAIKALHGGME